MEEDEYQECHVHQRTRIQHKRASQKHESPSYLDVLKNFLALARGSGLATRLRRSNLQKTTKTN